MASPAIITHKLYLLLEFVAIFFVVPLAVRWQWFSVPLVVIPLYLLCIYAVIWLLFRGRVKSQQLWLGMSITSEKLALKTIAKRFVLVVVLVWWVVYAFYPEKLLAFPLHHPVYWLFFVVLYPVFSVYPQELLFRAFFFQRYADIFPDNGFMIMLSVLMFAFMHIVFANGIVILCTLIGGYFFADTYARTGSLRVVCLEHSLYGSVVFTFGLGEFFVLDAAKSLLM